MVRGAFILIGLLSTAQGAQLWAGYERLSREQLASTLAAASTSQPPQLPGKYLADLNLSGLDFRRANLSASVFNGSQLVNARLDGCNLTVSFFERAQLPNASLRDAILFSVQMADAVLTRADLSGARLIGDLRGTDLSGAVLTHMNAAADMRNQSMGLMRTRIVNAKAPGADLSDSDFSRADLSFTDFTGAKMVRTNLTRAELSGAVLKDVDLSGANLRDAILIDADFSRANLTNADFTGAEFRGTRGLDTAVRTGAQGLP